MTISLLITNRLTKSQRFKYTNDLAIVEDCAMSSFSDGSMLGARIVDAAELEREPK